MRAVAGKAGPAGALIRRRPLARCPPCYRLLSASLSALVQRSKRSGGALVDIITI